MPAYNAESYVSEAINSMLNQSYDNFELLIADDASNDNTKKIICEYSDPRILTFHNDVNKGYLETCNILFRKCGGDMITFQDADDVSHPDRLKFQIEAFEADPELALCGTWIRIVDKHGEVIRVDEKTTDYDQIKASIGKQPQFCGSTIMIPKSILKAFGGYRPYFDRIGSEDYDWSCRIVEKHKSINLPLPLYDYRQLSNSISKEVSALKKNSAEMVRFFAQQRSKAKPDALEAGSIEVVKKEENRLNEKYKKDKSLLYIEYASTFNYNKMYLSAIKSSWMAVGLAPFNVRNIRTLLYCIKVFMFSYVWNSRNH